MVELNLKGLEVECILGDLPSERERTQRIVVDLALNLSTRADETDDLADTVDYAALSDRIRRALVDARCRLLERAARIVCDEALRDGRVRSAAATVTKTGSVPGLAAASATVSR